MSNIININYSNDTINDICCICMDDENLSTLKCSQCVNKFHLNCICEWATAAINNKYLFNIFAITNVTCPCCRTIIKNKKITMRILYNMFIKYKYKFIGLFLSTSILLYLIYIYSYYNPIESFVIFYNIFGFYISIKIEQFCKYYNIQFGHRILHD
jgi:hypothetical protein